MAQNKRKGFTLVELMIVIAIIGILAATLLPTLTSGQARGRDTARKSSLTNIVVGLETFYQDRGHFPSFTGQTNSGAEIGAANSGCITSSTGGTAEWLQDLFKGKLIPTDPQPATIVTLCGIKKSFGYWPMKNHSTDNASFALVANVETYQTANNNTGSHMAVATAPATFEDGISSTGYFTTTANNTGAMSTGGTTDADSVFVVVQG